MAYHKAKEEYKWKQWKEEEEKQLRSLGMDEEAIQELRYSDWKDFKAERRYQEHRAAFPQFPDWESPATEEQETEDISGTPRMSYNFLAMDASLSKENCIESACRHRNGQQTGIGLYQSFTASDSVLPMESRITKSARSS